MSSVIAGRHLKTQHRYGYIVNVIKISIVLDLLTLPNNITVLNTTHRLCTNGVYIVLLNFHVKLRRVYLYLSMYPYKLIFI